MTASHAERLHAWANPPKELLVFERGDHNSILLDNREACFAAVGGIDTINQRGSRTWQ